MSAPQWVHSRSALRAGAWRRPTQLQVGGYCRNVKWWFLWTFSASRSSKRQNVAGRALRFACLTSFPAVPNQQCAKD